MASDKKRARTFKEQRITRSRAWGNEDDVLEMEKERCCDNERQLGDMGLSGLVFPVLHAIESRLDPLVLPFSPSAQPRTKEPPSWKPASPSLEPTCPTTDLSPPAPLLAQAGDCDVASPDAPKTLHVNGHMVISKCGIAGNGKPGCTNNSCMYGGGQGAVDYDHIYDCKQCTGLASSSICARCLINGGTCDPGHDQ